MKNLIRRMGWIFAVMAIFFVSGFLNNNVVLAVDKVNINTADATALDTIPEVGPATATKIITYRITNGPFLVIEDIMKVSGIKQATFDKMKDYITVSDDLGIIIPPITSTTPTTTDETATTTATTTTPTVIYSVHYIQEELSDYEEPTTFEVGAGRGRLSYVNSPVSFEAEHKISKDLNSKNCDYVWNFGDGASLTGEDVEHIYKYVGEYNVVLNGVCGDLKSVARTAVKVLVPSVLISSKADGAVEISNQGKYEINLYNWKIQSGGASFVFPQDTIISANKSVTFPVENLKIATTNIRDGIILVDVSNKVVAQVNSNIAGVNLVGEISLEELTKFVLAYQEASQPTRQHTTLTAINSTAPNPSLSNEGEGATASSTESNIPLMATVAEAPSFGFWSKLFHPIRTIQNAFY